MKKSRSSVLPKTSNYAIPMQSTTPRSMDQPSTQCTDQGSHLPTLTNVKPLISKATTAEKNKRIFICLSYIIIAYIICWSPFHIVFDVLFFNKNAVTFECYTFASWCCYFNSTLNPFLYAAANKEFRLAFRKVFTSFFHV